MAQDPNILWQQCAVILRDNLTPTVYNTWFASLEVVDYADDVLVLRVKSQFVAEYIEENYIDLLSRVIWRVFGDKTRLEYRVLIDSTTGAAATYPSERKASSPVQSSKLSVPADAWDTQLNPLYTFRTFIAGETNKLARTAGLAIAKDPGKTVFNPIFIYGGSGVGKTHLANAIGNEVASTMNTQRVLYVSANTFKLQYQEAAQQNKIPAFLDFYMSVDVLIIDDIQFFSGLKGTQDTFFHIFNYLHQSRKQLILTSDRSPLQLRDVEERLLTRFKWGLPVEIQRPDYALRRDILTSKMHRDGLHIPDEVVDYIASNACENVRDIEGVLASLMAYSTLMDKDIDMELAQSVVGRLVEVQPKEVIMEDVIGAVCEHSGIPEKAVLGQSRQKDVVRARQLVMYLCKRLTSRSLSDIGNAVGHRSHATVIHTLNTITAQMEYDKVLRHDAEILEGQLRS
ncbi:MAG: chromosomal replication initiator protein DnaA [Paludibacteraceae bacterium]|nr:chromosomal replication initiator protein DnaA [Paludibacteraceae bacterium]